MAAYIYAYKRAWKTQNSSYIYVDSWGGDDTLGDGTQDKPFQTINRAVLKSGIYILRGYFSEQVTSWGKTFYADFFGDAIYDGKGAYYLGAATSMGPGNNGMIIINTASNNNGITYTGNSILINNNSLYNVDRCAVNFCVYDNVTYCLSAINLFASYAQSNCSFINNRNVIRSTTSNVGALKCIYDNCKIFLDVQYAITSSNNKVDTCLFRVNCTFWVRNAANTADIRIDADGQTAAEKYAAIMDWFANGVVPTGYSKLPWSNCKITDNRIFNKEDSDTDGYNFDYSLIYGDKDNYPACYMDGGKHIGPFPPSLKIAFKNTADLTSSPFEIEVKTTDNLVVSNGRLTLGNGFAGTSIFSKPMPIPTGVNFNGINLPIIPDTERGGVFVTPFEDAIDFSESAKITLSTAGTTLTSGMAYYVKSSDAYASYAGNTYQGGSVITAIDSTSLCYLGGSGTACLYPIYRPTIYSGVKIKVAESTQCPPDFLSNDTAYPWIDGNVMSSPGDKASDYIGLRCLRVGNLITGGIDTGTDGKPLTSNHPEYFITANASRQKFYIRARWVALKINITKYN